MMSAASQTVALRVNLMPSSLRSLIDTGTKLWLDSIDPDLVAQSREQGATGATSNPIIVADLLKTGRFDAEIRQLRQQGLDPAAVAWRITDRLVSQAEAVFRPVFDQSGGNDGYVSFEVDPLIEDTRDPLPHAERVSRYVSEAKRWAEGHVNRLIKIPATPAGIASLTDVIAAGVNVNVTLIFSLRQYHAATEAVWRGVQERAQPATTKSVYSIFVSRLDVYSEKACPQLSAQAQGLVGIVNAKRVWQANQAFWAQRALPLQQEIVFASTGTKKPTDAAWKYVEALAGSDIQTNPPATNAAVHAATIRFQRNVDRWPEAEVMADIDRHVDFERLEQALMEDGLSKFAEPQKRLIQLIAEK